MIVSLTVVVPGRNAYVDQDGRHYGIAIHNTSNTASAAAEARYAQVRTDGVSAHFYVDGLQVIQSLDTRAKAGHAGSPQGNENAIAVEIVGQNSNPRAWWLANVAWDQLGRVLAAVIAAELPGFQVRRASVAEMQTNPQVAACYAHDDMRLAWGHTDHDDPGPNFPWDRLFDSVNQALTGQPMQEEEMRLVQAPSGPGLADSIWLIDGMHPSGKPYLHGPSQALVDELKACGVPFVVLKAPLDQTLFHRMPDGAAPPIPAAAALTAADIPAIVKAVNDDAAARAAQ